MPVVYMASTRGGERLQPALFLKIDAGPASQLVGHLDHGLAKTERREEVLRRDVLARGVQHTAWRAAGTQAGAHAVDEQASHTSSASCFNYVNVMQRAMCVEQRVPV